jgi:hypothetical protein
MSVSDQQKLLLLLDLTNLLIYGQLKHQKGSMQYQKERKNEKCNLQKLAGRETPQGISFRSDQDISLTNRELESPRSKKRIGSQMKLIALEMC